MRAVVIIGTSHDYQYVRSVGTSPGVEEFRAVLKVVAALQRAQAIAEEMSLEALGANGAIDSIPRQVAEELSISHRYCDPDSGERAVLGLVTDEDAIRMPMTFAGKPTDEIDLAVAKDRSRREQEWIRRLEAVDRWPVIFICGRNHVAGFHDHLVGAGIGAQVYASDWRPSSP